MSGTERVIVKHLPTSEVVKTESTEAEITVSCECIDRVFHEPRPDCTRCNGTGVMKIVPKQEWELKTSGKKDVWVTSATIITDERGSIYDDDEDIEGVLTSTHALFNASERVQVGDFVISTKDRTTYVIRGIQRVRDLNNVARLDCSIERV